MKGFTSSKLIQALKQAFITLQPLGVGRIGMDAIARSVFELNTGAIRTLTAISTDSINNGIEVGITITALNIGLNARDGDMIRFQSGGLDRGEISITKVIDVDNIIIGHPIPITLVGSTLKVMRYNVLTLDEDGALVVAVGAAGPTQYVEDTVDTEVEIDTAAPANNKPMPSAMYIEKDGVRHPVTRDTGTPGNNIAVPVEIVGAAGQDINITAGDINVQTTHVGANADSMRIGNGVNEMGVNASLEALVHDQDSLAKLTDIETALNAAEGISDAYLIRDFGSSPLTNAAGFVTARVLTAGLKKVQVVNNSGFTIAIRNDAVAAAQSIIAPGATLDIDLVGIATDTIEIASIVGDADSGNIYINFGG